MRRHAARRRRHRYTWVRHHRIHGFAMPRPIHCFLALALAALLLAGCGNKGDLVLPDQQPKKHKKSQPATPAKAPDAKPAQSSDGAEPVH